MPHSSTPRDQVAEAKEELVQGILEEIERSYTSAGPTGPTSDLAEFFRALDETTLRSIAYRHGVFEEELETEGKDPRAPTER